MRGQVTMPFGNPLLMDLQLRRNFFEQTLPPGERCDSPEDCTSRRVLLVVECSQPPQPTAEECDGHQKARASSTIR